MYRLYRLTTTAVAFRLLMLLVVIHPFIHWLEGGSLDALMYHLVNYISLNRSE